MRWWMAISWMVAAALGACSVSNPDHCANLEGNATCAARDSNYPYCNKCTAANNGCVSDPVHATCDAGETTTPGGTSSTSTPATTDPTTTTATTTSPTTTGSTSDPSTSESSTSSSSSSTSTDSSSGSTGDPTDDPPPMCGNDVREPPEVCDGTDLNDLDCVIKDSDKYSGGTLQCTADCMAYDEQNCCLATGQTCPLNGQKCCAQGTCVLNCG